MTVTPNKQRPEASPQRPRSSETQMDELDGRLKALSEDSLADTINDEDSHYTHLRLELESDALNLEAETWSLAVDQSYMKELSKDAVKRQDVIYELMQTEMHHVRTLKVLLYVYKYELKQSALLDDMRLERLFPAVDALLSHHQHFLDGLKRRLEQSQEPESPNNYQISQLGDILITQFSGSVGEGMKECYSVFCSHQGEATKLYKEQLQKSKKFESLIKRIGQLPLVRRMGLPECFLLVTQRITKYPVLVERLIKNTEADTDEYRSLVQGLSLIKDTIEQVNEQVREYERLRRLREICMRLEPKSQGRISEDRVFRREDLIQGNRTLLHEGGVQWRTPGRQKDIHAVLLSDVLLLLQEKDQKFVFATMDKAPPVISLRGLIVREVALVDRAMYLICALTSNMYEIHTTSQAERDTWINHIREAVNSFIDEEEPYSEEMAQLQQYQKSLKEYDDQLRQSVEAKQQVCVSLYETVTGQECPHKGLLLKGEASDLHQGETLLQEAISEVENLQSLLMVRGRKMQSADILEESHCDSTTDMNGDAGEGPDTDPSSDLQFEETAYSDSFEQSADTVTPNGTLVPKQLPDEDTLLVCERMVLLAQRLNSLQVVLAKHGSQMELLQACQSKSKRSARQGNALLEQENQRNMERQKQELANLQKMQAQHREEQQRWEKERDRHRVQMEVQEAEVGQREEQCRQREEKLMEERAELEAQRDSYQHDLERLRESLKILEKDRDKHEQERRKLEKLKTRMNMANPALNVDDPKSLLSFPSFRSTFSGVSSVSGVTVRNNTATPYAPPTKSDSKDLPPKVPPRRESISPKPAKPHIPIHLRSTTNDSSPALKQQIPFKLEGDNNRKKVKTKPSHKRTNSAANIDVREVVPIRVSGKEGGSLKAHRTSSPQRIHKTDLFTPPGPSQNMKPSPSFSSHRRGSDAAPPSAPPAPPPFPKDILDPLHPKEIFL